MKEIKIKFTDFWPTWDYEDNIFVNVLRKKYRVVVLDKESKDTPDLLFYSRCGKEEHLKYDCIKIYFTGENDFPDFNECDYALSFYDLTLGDRHLRYPLYMLYEYNELEKPLPISDEKAIARNFCSLLMRNSTNCDPKRLEIIDVVESYKPVTYGGSFRNNIGGNVEEKIPFIANYKFNLALENSVIDGYVTEKILEPLVANTVPIYWGSDYVKKDFNPDSFIHVNDFQTLDSFLEYLKMLDKDNHKYLEILRAPKLRKGVSPDFNSQLELFLDNIVSTMKRHVVSYGEMNVLHQNNLRLNKLKHNKWAIKFLNALG